MVWEYIDQNREGDHICYISDLSKMKAHYPSWNISKSLDDIAGEFDAVITMGCGDSCPWVAAKRREDWALPDPKELDDDRA